MRKRRGLGSSIWTMILFQDPIVSYGKVNKGKLREVGGKYNPEGLFQKSVPEGFKLFT